MRACPSQQEIEIFEGGGNKVTKGYLAAALGLGAAILCVAPALAQQTEFRISAGDLKQALDQFARQSGREIIYKVDDIGGVRSPGVRALVAPEDALDQILSGTGFSSRVDSSGAIAIVKTGGGDDGAARTDGGGSEIVVTASRREQLIRLVPASVSAETGRTLARRGATQLEDIVRNTPGLSNPGPGSGNKTNLTIRGVATGTDPGLKQTTVSLMFDDIPLDPGSAGLGATNLRLVDVERVEVLRGPQGTLFGSGSLSGTLRIISNKPDLTGPGASAELTGAATRGGEGSIWGNAMVNQALIPDRLAIRAVGYGFQEGGWIDNSRTGETDVNRNETLGARLAVAARLGERLSVDIMGAYQTSKDFAAGESLYAPVVGASDPYGITTSRQSQESRLESAIVNLGLRYDFDALELISSSTYIRRKASLDDDAGYYTEVVGLQLGIPGLTGPTPAITTNNSDIFTQELRLVSTAAGPLQWTLGGFYLSAKADGGQWVTAPVLAPILGSGNLAALSTEGEQEELSAFGELSYTIGDRLDLTAGLRISDTTLRFDTLSSGLLFTGSPNPAVQVATVIRQGDTAYNPRFAIAFRPSEDLTLYVSAARGYRVGGPNLTAGLGGPNIPRAYSSDNLWNYELGAKGRAFDGTLRYNAAAYFIDWSNMQTSLSLNNVGHVGNAGSAHIYGAELEASMQITAQFEVGGSVSVNKAETASTVPNLTRTTGIVGITPGLRLPGSPEFQTSGFAQFNFDVAGNRAYLRASGQHVGDQYTDYDEKGTRFGDYAVADLRVGIALDRVEVIGFVNNLFDGNGKRSAMNRSTVGPIIAQPQIAYRIRPRTIGATVRVNY